MKFREVLIASLIAALFSGTSLEGQTASAAKSTAQAGGYRVLLTSNRDGRNRGYSVRLDGSRLTPLLPQSRTHVPQAVSGDGRMVVYYSGYVSRANGTGLRRLVRSSVVAALSHDGRLLAYSLGGIWIVGTDGRGRRHVTSGRNDIEPDWSPDAKALAFTAFGDERVFVQSLGGRRRPLAVGARPKWSPDGRWIGYAGRDGVYVVRPNGTHRHRVARAAFAFSWSPDSKRLAFVAGYLGIVGVDGRTPRKLKTAGMEPGWVIWAPDRRRLIVLLRGQIWTVGSDGRGLRRITTAGSNFPVGWTRLAPILPPARPLPRTERVMNARTVAARAPVSDLSADGSRVAFVTASPIDCDHAAVWTPAKKALDRFVFPAPCPRDPTWNGAYDLELAGSRATWVGYGGGNTWDFFLLSATLAHPLPVDVSFDQRSAFEFWDYRLRGDGDLLVFNQGSRLVRIGGGREKCQEKGRGFVASICSTIRRGAHAAPVDSVSGGLIAVREANEIAVVDAKGNVVRVFPFTAGAALLDGDHLVATRANVIERYSVRTGALEGSRPLSSGYKLMDVDGGIAVLRQRRSIRLLRLDDGRSLTIARGGPMFGDLEVPGLYYSYSVGSASRVVFLPRSELVRQLG